MKTSTLIIVMSLLMLSFFGCEKKDDTQTTNCEAKIKKAIDNTQQKTKAYSQNITVANCKAVKQALSDQIKAYESCISVTGLSLADINDLKAQLATLDCDN